MPVTTPENINSGQAPDGSIERLPQDEHANEAVPVRSPNGVATHHRSASTELARKRLARRRKNAFRKRLSMPVANWASRRTEWIAVLLALLVASCFIPHVLNFARRNEQDRKITRWLPFWQGLEKLEYQLYDARFTARGSLEPFAAQKIAIVAIDTTSLQAMGQWPWPRDWHARLIRRLKKAGARVIALDINFSDKQDPNPNGSLSRKDRELVAAATEAGNVIIPSSYRPERKQYEDGKESLVTLLMTPFDELDSATPDLSTNYIPPDIDGSTRRYAMYGVVAGSQIGSLAALAVGMHQKMLDGNENTRFYQRLTSARWPAITKIDYGMPLSKMEFNDDEMWLTPIDFWGPAGTFPTFSYSDVLTRNRFSDEKLKKIFKDRIVFVGATTESLKDVFSMPSFSTGVFKSSTGEEEVSTQISGVEIHASVAAMMLEGQYIHANGRAANIEILFAVTLAASLWIVLLRRPIGLAARHTQKWASQRHWPFRVHSIVWFGLYAGLGGMVNILFWQACKSFFIYRNLWVVATYPEVSAALASVLMLLVLFGVETAERRKMDTQMGRFMSPAIKDEILAHPEEEYPRSRRTTATVLFTDLEGFTTYSENHEPEEVVETLNAYMTRMVPIVREYGGEVDKYIGDAIMGFFGVPIPRFDHAARALLCAVAMQDECARFREDTGIDFYMRIGIHTGDVIAGCMGSEDVHCEHLNYTVIGDTVNLASRLEGKNKEFSSWIMCSTATYEAAPDIVEVEAASTQIKGKSQAVDVLIVRGLKGDPEYDKRWGRQLPAAPAGDTLREAEPEAPKALESPVLALPSGRSLDADAEVDADG